MVIKDLLQYGAKILAKNNISTPQLDASILLCHVLKKNRSYLIINHTQEVSNDEEETYISLIEKRANGMPCAYITSKKEFMSLDFYVNENVLIPRPDTETLCEHVIETNVKDAPIIADICSGSGCIGISLAVYIKDARIVMADVSDKAIEVAQINAQNQGVSERCMCETVDILKEEMPGCFDIVVSNPPYIETKVIDTLERDVKDYEPRLALDGGEDGLIFYRRIAKIAIDMLKSGGMLAFEVGHTQSKAVENILKENGFTDTKIISDLSGIERVVSGIKK